MPNVLTTFMDFRLLILAPPQTGRLKLGRLGLFPPEPLPPRSRGYLSGHTSKLKKRKGFRGVYGRGTVNTRCLGA